MEKMQQDLEVKDYFERDAREFDDIYNNGGAMIKKIATKVFRKGMKQRFNLTIKLCSKFKNKTILDIGTGAGRFLIPLAEMGFKCVGIDYSKEMIRLAKEHLKKYNLRAKKQLKIKYECSDFLKDYENYKGYDISLAIGVFDYLNDPVTFVRRMKTITKNIMIVSFPSKFVLQAPIRKIWLKSKNCPVYFYTKEQIKKIYYDAGIDNIEIIDYSAGYLVKAEMSRLFCNRTI